MTPQTEQILAGKRRAIARQISRIENNHPAALKILSELFPYTGRAYLVGITGPPGSGKSTLVNQLAKVYRRAGKTVAVLAVDPTSPFSGGAILGDRIRLHDLAGDRGVFVRSMATRGHMGGLARASADAIKVFDAAGFDIILIETVGVGQDEVEIAGLAHTVLVVDVPGLGDDVQAIKAGILEVADVFVINKADREGVEQTVAALQMMLELSQPQKPSIPVLHHGQLMEVSRLSGENEGETNWRPPLCKTIATTGQGVAEVVAAIEQHRAYQLSTNGLQQRERSRLIFELEQMLKTRLLEYLMASLSPQQLNQVIDKLVARQLDPYSAIDTLLTMAGSVTTDTGKV